MKNILYTIILSFLFLSSQSALAAQCINTGLFDPAVICSKYRGGDAVLAVYRFKCGKGQCVDTGLGWKCSKIEGGGAAMTNIGARCQGGCERPSRDNCMVPER
jgi:hypothetical protein